MIRTLYIFFFLGIIILNDNISFAAHCGNDMQKLLEKEGYQVYKETDFFKPKTSAEFTKQRKRRPDLIIHKKGNPRDIIVLEQKCMNEIKRGKSSWRNSKEPRYLKNCRENINEFKSVNLDTIAWMIVVGCQLSDYANVARGKTWDIPKEIGKIDENKIKWGLLADIGCLEDSDKEEDHIAKAFLKLFNNEKTEKIEIKNIENKKCNTKYRAYMYIVPSGVFDKCYNCYKGNSIAKITNRLRNINFIKSIFK